MKFSKGLQPRFYIHKKIYLLVWVLLFVGTKGNTQTISQDFTGMWMNDKTRTREKYEKTLQLGGMITLCPDGTASYQVFGNQLKINFLVKQKEVGPYSAILEFYFEGADVGHKINNVKFPARKTLVAKAELAQEFKLSFKYFDSDFIKSVRSGIVTSTSEKLKIFPSSFYFNSESTPACILAAGH